MSNEEEISKWFISRHGDFIEEDDTVEDVYNKVNDDFIKNSRSSLDHVLGDEREDFMETIRSQMFEPIDEPLIIEEPSLFLPTGKSTTIEFTDDNLGYVEQERGKGRTLREIANNLNLNYNTLRGNLSKLRNKKS